MHYFFSFLVLFSFIQNTKAQDKLSSETKKDVLKICNTYLVEEQKLIDNKDYTSEALTEVTEPKLLEYFKLESQYIHLMGYDIVFNERIAQEIIITDAGFSCAVKHVDREDFILDLEKISNKWLIVGYGGERIGEEDFEHINHLIDSAKVVANTRETIKKVTKQFVEGINELRKYGTSNLLKKVTEPKQYESLVLSTKLDSLEGHRKRDFELKEIHYVQINSDTTADCRIIIKGNGGSRLNLEKQNENWIVVGENGGRITEAKIQEQKNRIRDFNEIAIIEKKIDEFSDALNIFLIDDNTKPIQKVTTNELFEYLQLFKLKAGMFNPNELAINGIKTYSHSSSNFKFSGDTAIVENYGLSLHLVKVQKNWKIAGFDGKIGKELTWFQLEKQFQPLKFTFGISYPKPFDLSTIEIVIDDDSNYNFTEDEEIDSTVKSPLTDNYTPPQFPEGKTALLKNIDLNKTQTVVYVSFIVERNGNLTNLTVVSPNIPNELKKEAIEIVRQMPNWVPAVEYKKVVRSNLVLPVVL